MLLSLIMQEKNTAVKRPMLLSPAERAKIAKGFPQIRTYERSAPGL